MLWTIDICLFILAKIEYDLVQIHKRYKIEHEKFKEFLIRQKMESKIEQIDKL
jgi:hypothetical protein